MPNWTGSLGSTGSPTVRITVAGVYGPGQEFDAIIDTGYTGFLTIPLVQAFPLGLVLFGTTTLMLADGSTSYRLTAFGNVKVMGEEQTGVIVLEPQSTEVLLGMELLLKFKKALVICHDPNMVHVVDASLVAAAMATTTPTPGAPAAGAPAPGAPAAAPAAPGAPVAPTSDITHGDA